MTASAFRFICRNRTGVGCFMKKIKVAIADGDQLYLKQIMLTLPLFDKALPKDNKILRDGKFVVREVVSMGY